MSRDPRGELQEVLGDAFRLERELSGGGMSRLFLATEKSLKRPVVIKLLPPELTSEVTAARFQREIELAAQLRHPHILPVHAAGVRGGLLFYVMPYVTGESLRARLRREGRLPVNDALRVLDEIADALAYAHSRGVIHRDIKPENILIDHGHAVLMDFGIARTRSAGTGSDRITATGTTVGTLGYMAPEQVAGEDSLDGRTDVYGLAIVGYEMLAGRPPYFGASPREVLTAQLSTAPPNLTRTRQDVPGSVAEAIHRALSSSPHERFASAAEFRDTLARAIGAPVFTPVDVAIAPRRGLTRWLASLVGRRPQPVPVAESRPPLSDCMVAVLPFTVRGSDRLSYLGDGMVDLLSARLNGAADLCIADPRAILGLVAQESGGPMDPILARRIAERLGAGMFVLGSLLEVGGTIQLDASLYDARGVVIASGHTAVDDEAQLLELVDRLAIQLLAGRERGQGPAGHQLAAVMTDNLEALKAHLEGESHFRSGQYGLARDAFRRATQADPGFALAWYRLSVAAEWGAQRELQDEAAEQALRHGARLSERDRQALEAFVAWRRGDPRAESMYRNVLATNPHDLEAWVQLGEVIFHYGPMSGRSISESREAWEQALRFDPGHLGAIVHLGRIAAVEGKRDELYAMTDRAMALSRDGERSCEIRALRAFGSGDPDERRSIEDDLRLAGDFQLNVTLRTVATYTRGFDGAITVSGIATDPSRDSEFRALAHVQRAYLEIARGRRGAAQEELAAAERIGTSFGLVSRAFFAVLPFLRTPPEELERLRAELVAWDAGAVPDSGHTSLFVRVHNGVHPHIRAYLLALLSIRMGDQASALRYGTELEGLAGTGRSLHVALARALARAVHAHVAIARGQSAIALAALENARPEWGYDVGLASPFFSGSLERFVLADLLHGHGRGSDALRLFNSFAEVSVYDLVFLPPSHLKRAQLLDRQGDREAAARHYARFVELWTPCDDELRPALTEAEARLAAIGTPPAGVA